MVPVIGCNLFIYLVFLLLNITRLSKADNLCQNKYNLPVFGGYGLGSYCEETLHNLNCSVGPRESIERDTTLECKIERLRGWEKYRRKLGNLRRCSFEDCEPSQLTSLRIVRISQRHYLDEKNSYPIIELNFTVPKPTVSRTYRVGGISLTFSSNDDPEFETRYRLLDFSNYKYSSPDNDENHKRTLSFPCFMGYQHEPCQSDDYKVYSVSLKSFSKLKTNQQKTTFTELTYNITVYNFYVYHPHLWKSTIAVTFFPGNKDVTFLFDPVPNSVTFKMYNISLINVSYNKTYGTKLILKGQSTKQHFMNLMDGICYILIEVITKNHNCPESCRFTRSHKFTIGNPHPMQVAAVIGDSEYPATTAISMVSGIVLSLVLLGFFTYYRWRKKHSHQKDIELKSPLNGTLIYSRNNKNTCTLANEFAKFCWEELQIQISFLKPQNDIVQRDIPPWFKEKLASSKIVIIFWTPGSNWKQQEYHDSFGDFDTGVKQALEHKDDKKLACVYFNKSHKATIPSDVLMAARVFYFPEKFSQFCYYLHGHKKRRNYNLTKTLKDTISEFNRNNRASQSSAECRSILNESIHSDKMDDEHILVNDCQDHIPRVSKPYLMENQPLMESVSTSSLFLHSPNDKSRISTTIKKGSLQDQEIFEEIEMKSGTGLRSTCIYHRNKNRKSADAIIPNLPITPNERKLQCMSPKPLRILSDMPTMVHVRPSDSVSTLQLFGSGDIQEHEKPSESKNSNSGESPHRSSLSISRLQFKTIDCTLEDCDQSSQSSSNENCGLLSRPASPAADRYECTHSSCIPKVPRYQELFLNIGSYHNCSIGKYDPKSGEIRESDLDLTNVMKCPILSSKKDKTPECFYYLHDDESYSVCSEDIRSSEIDLTEFTQ